MAGLAASGILFRAATNCNNVLTSSDDRKEFYKVKWTHKLAKWTLNPHAMLLSNRMTLKNMHTNKDFCGWRIETEWNHFIEDRRLTVRDRWHTKCVQVLCISAYHKKMCLHTSQFQFDILLSIEIEIRFAECIWCCNNVTIECYSKGLIMHNAFYFDSGNMKPISYSILMWHIRK